MVQIIKLHRKNETVSDRHPACEVLADIGGGQATHLDAISQKGHNGGRFGRCLVRCRACQDSIWQKAPANFGQERLRAGVYWIADDGDLLRPARRSVPMHLANGRRPTAGGSCLHAASAEWSRQGYSSVPRQLTRGDAPRRRSPRSCPMAWHCQQNPSAEPPTLRGRGWSGRSRRGARPRTARSWCRPSPWRPGASGGRR